MSMTKEQKRFAMLCVRQVMDFNERQKNYAELTTLLEVFPKEAEKRKVWKKLSAKEKQLDSARKFIDDILTEDKNGNAVYESEGDICAAAHEWKQNNKKIE